MNIKTGNLTGLALGTLLAVSLAVPSVVYAGGGHRGHHDHHDHHDHHRHHDHYDNYWRSGGQVRIYSQPPVYYQQQYYPQPQYNYYPPAPVYVVPPPRVSVGVNTPNVDFMLRY